MAKRPIENPPSPRYRSTTRWRRRPDGRRSRTGGRSHADWSKSVRIDSSSAPRWANWSSGQSFWSSASCASPVSRGSRSIRSSWCWGAGSARSPVRPVLDRPRRTTGVRSGRPQREDRPPRRRPRNPTRLADGPSEASGLRDQPRPRRRLAHRRDERTGSGRRRKGCRVTVGLPRQTGVERSRRAAVGASPVSAARRDASLPVLSQRTNCDCEDSRIMGSPSPGLLPCLRFARIIARLDEVQRRPIRASRQEP